MNDLDIQVVYYSKGASDAMDLLKEEVVIYSIHSCSLDHALARFCVNSSLITKTLIMKSRALYACLLMNYVIKYRAMDGVV